MLDYEPCASHIRPYLILARILQTRQYYYPYFTNEEPKLNNLPGHTAAKTQRWGLNPLSVALHPVHVGPQNQLSPNLREGGRDSRQTSRCLGEGPSERDRAEREKYRVKVLQGAPRP